VIRRRFLAAGGACCALAAARALHAQPAWNMPARFARPETSTDEGGLWALMDREEMRLQRSPFAIRDAELREYVQEIACRLGGAHCPDIRVHLVRTPLFNASMAPNGMMQVWTGLMLRMDNEAQFAAVLGHEIGHYLERHSVDRLRDVKSRSAFIQFLGVFGLVGAVGQLAVLADAFGYSREQERDADRIGVVLMRNAGYDAAEASKVWANLLAEANSRPEAERKASFPLFATHPGVEERKETLAKLASEAPGGAIKREVWQEKIKPFRREWLGQEVKRGRGEESITLLTRLITEWPEQADYLAARGEVYRLRAQENDLDAAVADFKAAVALGGETPEAHRGLAFIFRQRKQLAEARASFQRYIDVAPQAPDVAMIKSYLEDLEK